MPTVTFIFTEFSLDNKQQRYHIGNGTSFAIFFFSIFSSPEPKAHKVSL